MGVHSNVDYNKFPEQGSHKNNGKIMLTPEIIEDFLKEITDVCNKYHLKLVGACMNESINGEIVIMDQDQCEDNWDYSSEFRTVIPSEE